MCSAKWQGLSTATVRPVGRLKVKAEIDIESLIEAELYGPNRATVRQAGEV